MVESSPQNFIFPSVYYSLNLFFGFLFPLFPLLYLFILSTQTALSWAFSYGPLSEMINLHSCRVFSSSDDYALMDSLSQCDGE